LELLDKLRTILQAVPQGVVGILRPARRANSHGRYWLDINLSLRISKPLKDLHLKTRNLYFVPSGL